MTTSTSNYSTVGRSPFEPHSTCWPEKLTLRPIRDPEDLSFLLYLYASSREDELNSTGWPKAQKEHFLSLQFKFQYQYYQKHFPKARFEILQSEGQDIGRLYQNWGEEHLNLIDIVLLPAWRNKGIGSRILAALQAEAARCGKGMLLHVEPYNPAMRLYQRMGFYVYAENGPYCKMYWQPQAFVHTVTEAYS